MKQAGDASPQPRFFLRRYSADRLIVQQICAFIDQACAVPDMEQFSFARKKPLLRQLTHAVGNGDTRDTDEF